MHTFKVWAPNASNVAVRVDQKNIAMESEAGGWWRKEVDTSSHGTDYEYVLGEGSPRPDPRSAWQPQGINGPSRVVDHGLFSWTDKHWQARPLPSAIIYELHIGTFTPGGTFKSTIEKLDYLVDLGITHVEFMPVCEFSGKWGWGYDGVDLFAPHHAYGTPDNLKELVDACHAKGLAVLLDVVYNHLGPAGNYLSEFGPYFTDTYNTPWGQAVNLDDTGSHETRRFFADNALMWLRDYHFDGLRLDAVHALYDRSAVHFLEQLSAEVDTLSAFVGRHLVLIAESDLNDPRIVTNREAGGYGMNAQWSDDFHHALHTLITTENKGYYSDFGSYADLAKAFKSVFVYSGQYADNRGRPHGRPPVGLTGNRFLGYSQDHDQVGNRAQGERLSHLVNIRRQKIAAGLVLTAPFIPMLFEGEEFAATSPFLYFTNHEDKELGDAVSTGRKSEFKSFGWSPEEVPDPQSDETFQQSKLKWQEVEDEPHRNLLAWYKQLIQLRRNTEELTDGRLDLVSTDFDDKADWFILNRSSLQVVCNFAPDAQAVPIGKKPGHIICSEENWQERPGFLELPGESIALLFA